MKNIDSVAFGSASSSAITGTVITLNKYKSSNQWPSQFTVVQPPHSDSSATGTVVLQGRIEPSTWVTLGSVAMTKAGAVFHVTNKPVTSIRTKINSVASASSSSNTVSVHVEIG